MSTPSRLRRRAIVALLLVALPVAGCAGATTSALQPERVALLRLKPVGLGATAVEGIERALAREVARATAVPVLAGEDVRRAMTRFGDCRELDPERQDRCAVQTGAVLGASHAVAGAVGGLGRTHVLQLRVLLVSRAAVIRSLEETFFGELTAVHAGMGPLAERLFAVPPRRPWYTRWWVWTAAATVVAAAVVVPVVILTRRDPYENVTLP